MRPEVVDVHSRLDVLESWLGLAEATACPAIVAVGMYLGRREASLSGFVEHALRLSHLRLGE
jgi:hypothetical protein